MQAVRGSLWIHLLYDVADEIDLASTADPARYRTAAPGTELPPARAGLCAFPEFAGSPTG